MILNYGDQEFAVDFDTEFIMRRQCYIDGNNCIFCPESNDCLDELHFVYEELNESRSN